MHVRLAPTQWLSSFIIRETSSSTSQGATASRNQPKPLHLQLHAICSCLSLSLGIFTIIPSNFYYFGHSYNYDATIRNFILSIGWLLGWFSSMNILICPISCNSHQISHILKIFYSDIGVYFYVCIKIIFTIYYIYYKYIYLYVY
jgi:hypothetical protein